MQSAGTQNTEYKLIADAGRIIPLDPRQFTTYELVSHDINKHFHFFFFFTHSHIQSFRKVYPYPRTMFFVALDGTLLVI